MNINQTSAAMKAVDSFLRSRGAYIGAVSTLELVELMVVALATQSPQDERGAWTALTDRDRERAMNSMPNMLEGFMKTWGWLHFAKAIEEICREKNFNVAASAPAQQAGQRKTLESMAAESALEQDPELSTPPQPVAAEVVTELKRALDIAERYVALQNAPWSPAVQKDDLKMVRAALSGTGSDESKKGEA